MNKKGFTLVEVLVSLALVSTIAIFLFQIIFIIRDIYAEKNIKSEIYIESSNISNIINKDIFNKDKDGIYIKNINKVSNDELYITYSDGTKNNIVIDRSNNTITYGNYTVSILDVAKIGNIEMYYNYETTDLNKNGICYIKIPITHDDYKNDFGIVITYRYNSSKTKINGEVSIRPGGEEGQSCEYNPGVMWTFDYTGNVQNFTVPCDGTYKLEVWGAGPGGKGGYSHGNVSLSGDDIIYVVVGGTPYNGGGGGGNGSGGGATHIGKTENLLKDTAQADVYLVAGGGGSNGGASGGYGGGTNGSAGGSDCNSGGGGYGASQTGGGGGRTAQVNSDWNRVGSSSGSYGQGGSGCGSAYQQGGGGGGGGWYGGGGGCGQGGWGRAGGGGGSGYIGGVTDGETIAGNQSIPTHDGTSTMTGNSGHGYAKITLVSY